MLTGLSSAAAGMAAQRQRMDAVSNDLSNANTTGYKRVRVAFRDLVYQEAPRGTAPGVRLGSGAAAAAVGRTFEQGAMRSTGRPLDVALQGPGFLRVRLPDGRAALTRDGNLQVDGRGRLATASGALVQPAITVPSGVGEGQVAIGADGTVTAAGRTLGRLDIVSVRAPQSLQPVGDNAFVATPESGPIARAGAGTTLAGGTLEASNVDMAEAMVAMIESQRAFELASKAITTADQMMGVANEVKR
jgi:flagellar basal-body rod protein FlgG